MTSPSPGVPVYTQKHRDVSVLRAPVTTKTDEERWTDHLRRGIPLLIDGASLHMQRVYSPDYFAQRLGDRIIKTIDAINGVEEERTAADVFRIIGSPEGQEFMSKIKVGRTDPCHLTHGFLTIISGLPTPRCPRNSPGAVRNAVGSALASSTTCIRYWSFEPDVIFSRE